MTTLQRKLRAACPYVRHNGPEGYICLHRPAYNGSNITPPPAIVIPTRSATAAN